MQDVNSASRFLVDVSDICGSRICRTLSSKRLSRRRRKGGRFSRRPHHCLDVSPEKSRNFVWKKIEKLIISTDSKEVRCGRRENDSICSEVEGYFRPIRTKFVAYRDKMIPAAARQRSERTEFRDVHDIFCSHQTPKQDFREFEKSGV